MIMIVMVMMIIISIISLTTASKQINNHHKLSHLLSCLASAPAFISASSAYASPFRDAACSALSPLSIKRQACNPSTKPPVRYLLSAAARLTPASIKNCKQTRFVSAAIRNCSPRASYLHVIQGPAVGCCGVYQRLTISLLRRRIVRHHQTLALQDLHSGRFALDAARDGDRVLPLLQDRGGGRYLFQAIFSTEKLCLS